MYIWWGPALLCFYNDAYRRTLGPERHPGSLGRPGREVWAEIWHLIGDQVDLVMAGGGSTWDENRAVPVTRFGQLDEVYWTYSYSPIDDEAAAGGIGGVLVVCAETTETVLAERRQAFRLSIEERLRGLVDPAEVVAATSEALGRYLCVGQVGYLEVEAGDETGLLGREWNDGSMPSNAGRHLLDDYGSAFIAALRRGETVAIADVRLDRRTATTDALATFSRASIKALLDVPLVKAGRLVAVLAVHNAQPRIWLPNEIALAREVAEQTWVAAEQAGAEAALRDSEQRFRSLAEGVPVLVWRSGDLGRWTWSSPQWQNFTGQTLAQSTGLGWLDAVHPDDCGTTQAAWATAASTGSFDVDHRLRRAADVQYLWHQSRSSPLRDDNGRIIEWVGTTTDVHQLKELQERQTVLVAELQHRTRNLIAIVRSGRDDRRSASDVPRRSGQWPHLRPLGL